MVEGLDTGDPLGPSVGTSAPFGTGGTVGIIGLGGMGSAAAYHLARRGVRVVGFEQFACAHDRGSSHGDSRVIREAYFEHPSYVPLVQRAYDLWSETQDLAGEELLTICGGLMLGRPDDEVVVGTLASARRWDIPHQILTAADVRWRYPKLAVPDDHVGVLERRGGFVRPEASVRVHNRMVMEGNPPLVNYVAHRSVQSRSNVAGAFDVSGAVGLGLSRPADAVQATCT